MDDSTINDWDKWKKKTYCAPWMWVVSGQEDDIRMIQ